MSKSLSREAEGSGRSWGGVKATALGALGIVLGAWFGVSAGAQEIMSTLKLTSTPDKALVTCDGVLRQETPTTITGLNAGQHLVVVEKEGYLPARRTVTLAPGQASALAIPLEPVTGLVLVQAVPEGAEIEINGAHRGKAPLLVSDLVPGRYRLKASATGFLSREVEFEVEGRIPKTVSVSLASDSATLAITSKPEGAEVKINGLTKGVTPCTLDRLPAGDAEVVLVLANYAPYKSTVKLQANEAQALDAVLNAFPTTLGVITTPVGAKVFLDDALKGQAPLTLDVTPGSHSLRAEMDGYAAESRTVEVMQAEKKVEELSLVRAMGQLEVLVKPDGVSLSVDGVDKGVIATAADGSVAKMALDLPVGEHLVVLFLKGYGPVERRITIKQGETVSIKELLKRSFVADTRIKLVTGEILTGVMGGRLPNDDVELETQLGIYKTIKAEDIGLIESLKPAGKK